MKRKSFLMSATAVAATLATSKAAVSLAQTTTFTPKDGADEIQRIRGQLRDLIMKIESFHSQKADVIRAIQAMSQADNLLAQAWELHIGMVKKANYNTYK